MNQNKTPLADALSAEAMLNDVPFDVPGHKGRLSPLADYFGEHCLHLDRNSRRSIDNAQKPTGVIAEAEALAAEAFGSCDAVFMTGGTTSAVQAMILSVCSPGDKIILPRNVHASVINGVILADAIPVYVDPGIHPKLGISLGMSLKDVEDAIYRNMDAKAVFVNNPTYYGICSELTEIVRLAHNNGMAVIADEAHGAHFYFSERLPVAAIHAGADLAAVSMHKTGGSLTQSSLLLIGKGVDKNTVRTTVNLMRSTSSSYLLMSSLDIARRFMATKGEEALSCVIDMVDEARNKINALGKYYAYADELTELSQVNAFDHTKLSIYTLDTGMTGIEVYKLLQEKYGIYMEFGDLANILAVSSIGDAKTPKAYEKLVSALAQTAKRATKDTVYPVTAEYFRPRMRATPRKAYYAKKQKVSIKNSVNRISGEFVMCYPPGIPLVAPGELITQDIIDYIRLALEKGCIVTGNRDGSLKTIDVLI